MMNNFFIEHRHRENNINSREIVVGYDINVVALALLGLVGFFVLGKKALEFGVYLIRWGRVIAPTKFASSVDEVVEYVLIGAINKMPEIDKKDIKTISENIHKLKNNEIVELTQNLINANHSQAVKMVKQFL